MVNIESEKLKVGDLVEIDNYKYAKVIKLMGYKVLVELLPNRQPLTINIRLVKKKGVCLW